MITHNKLTITPLCYAIAFKAKAYFELLKFRLSFLVAFSAGFGYRLATKDSSVDWLHLTMLCIGGFLVSGSSIAVNQILEKAYDKRMARTQHRPLPTKRLSVEEAIFFALFTGIIGLSLLYKYTNLLTVTLSLLSLLLYTFVYTPLKRVGPVAVLIGAFPGALPPLIGWAAATGRITYEAFILFGIQFIWQFPHFWAIAWVSDEDYKKAGFKLLPAGGKKDLNTAIQIMLYTLFLIPLGLLPAKFGLTGINSALIVTTCGMLFLSQTFYLMKSCTKKAAMKIMLGSFLYLPIVQVAYLLDLVL